MNLHSLLFYGYRIPYILFAYLLPCYSSLTSIRRNDNNKQRQWITYWMILLVSECIFSITNLLFNESLLYHLLKLSFVIWIVFPSNGGLEFISTRIIDPLLRNHSEEISIALHHGLTVLCNKLKEVLNKAIDSIPSLMRAASKVNEKT
ncbi:hypothetical protein WA588_006117, partial [Blastocystis sp. NMH]